MRIFDKILVEDHFILSNSKENDKADVWVFLLDKIYVLIMCRYEHRSMWS